jgi:hypothetical protein
MRTTEEKEFEIEGETLKVIHTRLRPRAALKLGMRLLRMAAPLIGEMDVKDVQVNRALLVKALPLAFSMLEDDTIDELLGKVFATTEVIRDAKGNKPTKHSCSTPQGIDSAFDGALGKMLEVAQWIIGANLENFSFGEGANPATATEASS